MITQVPFISLKNTFNLHKRVNVVIEMYKLVYVIPENIFFIRFIVKIINVSNLGIIIIVVT